MELTGFGGTAQINRQDLLAIEEVSGDKKGDKIDC